MPKPTSLTPVGVVRHSSFAESEKAVDSFCVLGRYTPSFARQHALAGQAPRYHQRSMGRWAAPGGRENFEQSHAHFFAVCGLLVPQRTIEFVQSRRLHSRTIVRSGFVAFNMLAHVFAHYPERSALS